MTVRSKFNDYKTIQKYNTESLYYMSITVSTDVAANYNTTIAIDYNDNASYRKCLRQATNMNMNTLQIPWGQMDSD